MIKTVKEFEDMLISKDYDFHEMARFVYENKSNALTYTVIIVLCKIHGLDEDTINKLDNVTLYGKDEFALYKI